MSSHITILGLTHDTFCHFAQSVVTFGGLPLKLTSPKRGSVLRDIWVVLYSVGEKECGARQKGDTCDRTARNRWTTRH